MGSCTDVRKSTSKNDCPKHWKIISPRNEEVCKTWHVEKARTFRPRLLRQEDWKTLIDLDVLKEVAAPHLSLDSERYHHKKYALLCVV